MHLYTLSFPRKSFSQRSIFLLVIMTTSYKRILKIPIYMNKYQNLKIKTCGQKISEPRPNQFKTN